MRIQNNIAAMTAHRNMSIANAGNARSQEKLSSGLRINRAGDDAAGLSISEKMRGQIRGLNQASRNAQDGISLIQTAEGALNETQNILQRMRELAVQAANDTNTQVDRQAIGEEISQLFAEIDRIAETTQFNEMNLLDGSFGCTGPELDRSDRIRQERVDSVLTALTGSGNAVFNAAFDSVATGLGVIAAGAFAPGAAAANADVQDVFTAAFNTISSDDLRSIITTAGAGAAPPLTAAGLDDFMDEVGNATTFDDFADALADAIDPATGSMPGLTAAMANNILSQVGDRMQAAVTDTMGRLLENPDNPPLTGGGSASLAGALADLDAAAALLLFGAGPTAVDNASSAPNNASGSLTVADTFSFTQAFSGAGAGSMRDLLTNLNNALNTVLPEFSNAETAEQIAVANSSRKFHIGANAGQQVSIAVADSTGDALFGISDETNAANTSAAAVDIIRDADSNAAERILSMVRFSDGSTNVAEGNRNATLADAVIAAITSTQSFAITNDGTNEFNIDMAEARDLAIDAISHAISSVSERRSDLGALQNRLEHTIRNLDVASENLLSAEARIRDVDMASEVMEQTRTNILQQAAQSMLAMANQQPQAVLQLLG